MKSTQLLSVVLSLIMVFGTSAGSAFAQENDDFEDNSINDDRLDNDTYKDEHDDDHDDNRYENDKKDDKHEDLEDQLENYCEMSSDELAVFFDEHPRIAQFEDRLKQYCDLSEDEREDAIEDFIEEYSPQMREHDSNDLENKLEQYCAMSSDEREEFTTVHKKTDDHVAKMNEYCDLSEDEREEFIEEHREEYKDNMKQKMTEKPKEKHHMNYDRLCSLSESERTSEISDSEKLKILNNWCDMTPQERQDYKKEHHGEKITGEAHPNKMNDVPDKVKMAEMSPRLKEIIMDKHSISDERVDEIRMKYQERYGNITDEKKSELQMKFQKHVSSKTVKMSDEHKSAIHDRVAEMKAFKMELRERSSTMTDEEKQQLREEFIEKAKEMQLAWIPPRVQINAGVDAADVECREGFSLVMKSSNGVPICLKADTALKMIERGLAIPAN